MKLAQLIEQLTEVAGGGVIEGVTGESEGFLSMDPEGNGFAPVGGGGGGYLSAAGPVKGSGASGENAMGDNDMIVWPG